MAGYIRGGTVYFMKIFPHDDVLRRITNGHRAVLDMLISRAIIDQNTTFDIAESDRSRMAETLKCSEKSVANALSALSRPSYEKGPELLVRLALGKYMLNPSYYFIGNEEKRTAVLEYVRTIRAANKRSKRKRSEQPSRNKASVTPLKIVNQ